MTNDTPILTASEVASKPYVEDPFYARDHAVMESARGNSPAAQAERQRLNNEYKREYNTKAAGGTTGPANLLTTREAAARLGLTTEKVRQSVAADLLPHCGHGSRYLFWEEDVESFRQLSLPTLDADLDAARQRLGL